MTTRGELREAIRAGLVLPPSDRGRIAQIEDRGARAAETRNALIARVAAAVEGILESAQDDILRDLEEFVSIRKCPADEPGSGGCEKDEGHDGPHACLGLQWSPHTVEEFLSARRTDLDAEARDRG